MKHLFLTGLLVSGVLLSAQAQSGYDDDIYSSRPAAPARPDTEYGSSSHSGHGGYSSNGSRSSGSYNSGNYADDYDYIDYADDYTYATRFRRFDAPFYNVGYWSGFWSPFDYDPFWGSPWYGGYSYGGWGRPGVYVSVNIGGPYWSSGWGYNTWYGYGGFSSYWGHPYYSGWGHGGGYGWGYRNGYWDGYYAGLYGAGYGYTPYSYRRVNYAPRTAIGGVNGSSYRTPMNSGNRGLNVGNDTYRGGSSRGSYNGRQVSGAPAVERNTAPAADTRMPDRNTREVLSPARDEKIPGGRFENGAGRVVDAPEPIRNNTGRDRLFNDNNDRAVQEAPAPTRNRGGWFNNDRNVEAPVRENSRPRGGFFGNSDRNVEQPAPARNNDGWQNQRAVPNRGYSAPQAPQQIERRQQMPRFEQRSMEVPRSQPRYEAPAQRMGAPSGGSISAPSGGRGGGGYRR